jgi:hypothetical protein
MHYLMTRSGLQGRMSLRFKPSLSCIHIQGTSSLSPTTNALESLCFSTRTALGMQICTHFTVMQFGATNRRPALQLPVPAHRPPLHHHWPSERLTGYYMFGDEAQKDEAWPGIYGLWRWSELSEQFCRHPADDFPSQGRIVFGLYPPGPVVCPR